MSPCARERSFNGSQELNAFVRLGNPPASPAPKSSWITRSEPRLHAAPVSAVMPWYDDSWKDGYDAWKTREPDDYYDDDPDPECCGHEDYDADILTGRATCHRCGHVWWQTPEEIAAEVERIRRYDELTRERERPWARFNEWARGLWSSIRCRWRIRRAAEVNDEVPF